MVVLIFTESPITWGVNGETAPLDEEVYWDSKPIGEQWDKNVRLAREYPGEVWLVKAFIPDGPFTHLNVYAFVVGEDDEGDGVADQNGNVESGIEEIEGGVGDEAPEMDELVSQTLDVHIDP